MLFDVDGPSLLCLCYVPSLSCLCVFSLSDCPSVSVVACPSLLNKNKMALLFSCVHIVTSLVIIVTSLVIIVPSFFVVRSLMLCLLCCAFFVVRWWSFFFFFVDVSSLLFCVSSMVSNVCLQRTFYVKDFVSHNVPNLPSAVGRLWSCLSVCALCLCPLCSFVFLCVPLCSFVLLCVTCFVSLCVALCRSV